ILITDSLNHRIRLIEMVARKLIEIQGAATFVDSTSITISTAASQAELRYTVDGSEPSTHSLVYSEPFTITASTTIKARLFVSGIAVSEIISASFTRTSGGCVPIPSGL